MIYLACFYFLKLFYRFILVASKAKAVFDDTMELLEQREHKRQMQNQRVPPPLTPPGKQIIWLLGNKNKLVLECRDAKNKGKNRFI